MNRLLTVAIGFVATLAVSVACASEILYVDAAAPGANPTATWKDLSASGYDFANSGAVYNAASNSYVFDGSTAYLQGAGNEAAFDFETAKAGGAGNAFSVVMYLKPTDGSEEDRAGCPLSKMDAAGTGWLVNARGNTTRVEAILSASSGRVFDRGGVLASGWNMIVATFDGSGTVEGTRIYLNGSTTALTPAYSEDTLAGSILNNEQLLIGRNAGLPASVSSFKGEIGFVEVWNETLSASYSQTRWNGGDPLRAVPEPSMVVLLSSVIIGLAAYAWRKRR